MGNKLFCLIGASGSGKDAVAAHIALPKIASYRTREKRKGEIEGIHGRFISKEKFDEMDQNNEWIANTLYGGNNYGITRKELEPLAHSPMIYIVDEMGLLTLKENINKEQGYSEDDIVSIFIYSDREDVLMQMINAKRNSDEISARMTRYDEDMKAKKVCDYVVENTHGYLMHTVKDVYDIILGEVLGKGRLTHND